MNVNVEELVYLVKLRADDFLKGKASIDAELVKLGKNAGEATDAVEAVGAAADTAGENLTGAGKKATDAGKGFKGAGNDAKKAGDEFEGSGEQAEGAGEKVKSAGKKSRKAGKDTAGLGKSLKNAGKDAAKFGKTSAQSFSKVTKYALGFFGVALTLEGARRFFTGMTTDIMALSNAAAFMDMPIKQMDGFHKAAEAAGSSAAVVDGVLMKMQNAVNWKSMPMGAPEASTMALMRMDAMTGNRFKIMAQKNAKDMMLAAARALRSMPKAMAEQYAGAIGFDSGLFHDAMTGDLEKNQADAAKKSGQSDENAKRAREIKKTLVDLQTTAESIENAIYGAFGDDVNELLKKFDGELQEFGDYIVAHHDEIVGFFKDTASWVGKFSDAVGGASNALKILLGTYITAKSAGLLVGGSGAGAGGFKGFLGKLGIAGGVAVASEPWVDKALNWLFGGNDYFQNVRTAPTWHDFGQSLIGNGKGRWVDGKWDPLAPPQAPGNSDTVVAPPAYNAYGTWRGETFNSDYSRTSNSPGVSQYAQSARRKRPLGALLSPLLQNHNAMLEKRWNLPAGSLNALAMTESSGNPMAVSKAGAMGMYQIMPKTGKAYGMSAADFFDPIAEANVTAKILSENLRHYHGNLQLALAAYNAGVGRIDNALSGRGAPLTDETLNYPGRVLSYMDETRNYYTNTGTASAPGAIDNSQTSATHINTVNVNSHPLTVEELTRSIQEQSRRSGLTGAFISGVS
ncbi:lytic transglycosylase domain-containing protein [Serratia marcescens]|uniref:lytic transglycosylase domain-containing protein n=1 Tax=Serratia marcescens TaxID=615 RepID=UPI00124ACC55|nr:lytic transglycosylase domain-containing protein [Serratia marcescens]KAB1581161.1 transglycosylase SLT domain-containing protein [Serratia marcescens]